MNNLAYDYRTYEDEIYEIIEGDEFIMAPTANANHGSIITRLTIIFGSYIDEKGCGAVFSDDIDVHLPDGNLFRPDLSVVLDSKIIDREGTIHGVPDLVVEVLSRSTMKNDVGIKKSIYERNGVKEYWIVSPFAKSIEVYHLVDDKFELDDVYVIYSEKEWNELSDKQKSQAKFEIKVSIFDDLLVDIRKVFKWWFDE